MAKDMHEQQEPRQTLTTDEKKKLKHIVDECRKLEDEIEAAKEKQKELQNAAWEKCGMRPNVIKQLVKEQGWDEVKRMAQRQLEDSLDCCRQALGLLADLPLGEHAIARAEAKKKAKAASNLN